MRLHKSKIKNENDIKKNMYGNIYIYMVKSRRSSTRKMRRRSKRKMRRRSIRKQSGAGWDDLVRLGEAAMDAANKIDDYATGEYDGAIQIEATTEYIKNSKALLQPAKEFKAAAETIQKAIEARKQAAIKTPR